MNEGEDIGVGPSSKTETAYGSITFDKDLPAISLQSLPTNQKKVKKSSKKKKRKKKKQDESELTKQVIFVAQFAKMPTETPSLVIPMNNAPCQLNQRIDPSRLYHPHIPPPNLLLQFYQNVPIQPFMNTHLSHQHMMCPNEPQVRRTRWDCNFQTVSNIGYGSVDPRAQFRNESYQIPSQMSPFISHNVMPNPPFYQNEHIWSPFYQQRSSDPRLRLDPRSMSMQNDQYGSMCPPFCAGPDMHNISRRHIPTANYRQDYSALLERERNRQISANEAPRAPSSVVSDNKSSKRESVSVNKTLLTKTIAVEDDESSELEGDCEIIENQTPLIIIEDDEPLERDHGSSANQASVARTFDSDQQKEIVNIGVGIDRSISQDVPQKNHVLSQHNDVDDSELDLSFFPNIEFEGIDSPGIDYSPDVDSQLVSSQQIEDEEVENVAEEEITIKDETIQSDENDSIFSDETEVFDLQEDEISAVLDKPSVFDVGNESPLLQYESEVESEIEDAVEEAVQKDKSSIALEPAKIKLQLDFSRTVCIVLEDIKKQMKFDFLKKVRRPAKPLPETDTESESEPEPENVPMVEDIDLNQLSPIVCTSTDDETIHEISSDSEEDF